MTISLKQSVLILSACIVVFTIGLFLFASSQPVKGSVMVSSEYFATTTAPVNNLGATISASTKVRAGYGTLGSVIITGANTGNINIYDATTSNVLLRTNNRATSTILLASIPASAAAGTYTFDVVFSDGLYIDLPIGLMPTSTVTFR